MMYKELQETKASACAFKPNCAFFEAHGAEGWRALERLIEVIPKEIPWPGGRFPSFSIVFGCFW